MLKLLSITLIVLLISCVISYAGYVSEISEMTFNSEVLECDMPVLVWFFYNPTVNPVNPISDSLDKVATKNYKRVKILKMDSKFNIITADKYKIKKNNTYILFIDGKEKARTLDLRNEKEMTDFINQYIPLN